MTLASKKTINNVKRVLDVLKDGPLPISEILEQISEFGADPDIARQAFYNVIHSSTMDGRVVSTSNNRYDNKYKIAETIDSGECKRINSLMYRFIVGKPLNIDWGG